VASRIIYEWRTCTGAIRRFRFEILQHLLIVKYFGCNRCGIGIQDYRNRLISKIGRNFRFLRFVMKDIA